jgi:SAM-dependent methyltransferase
MTSTYVHGSAPEEQRRLAWLNELLNAACLRELGLGPDDRVLDLGSGLGQFTLAMARCGASVVGVERDARQLATAIELLAPSGERGRVEFRAGVAEAPPLLPGEAGTFDLAHARFLLEHLRDPLAAVRAMVAAVRAGGRIALFDDDHDLLRLWPPAPAVERWWTAYWHHYESVGNDPRIGRKLVSLLCAAGAAPLRCGLLNFGGCAGEPTFQGLVDNFAGVMETATAAIVERGAIAGEAIAAARAELAAWRRLPDAALWYPLPFAIGRRP